MSNIKTTRVLSIDGLDWAIVIDCVFIVRKSGSLSPRRVGCNVCVYFGATFSVTII